MSAFVCLLLATLSVWDYPQLQFRHENLRARYVAVSKAGAVDEMERIAREGTELLPEDPVWRYNHACALAYGKDHEAALDELERAVELGFTDVEQIRSDPDLTRLSAEARFGDILTYARRLKSRPVLDGPMAATPLRGLMGKPQTLGGANLRWNLDAGCFEAEMELVAAGPRGGNEGDLYVNLDRGHSYLGDTNFVGLTRVRFDSEAARRELDVNYPLTVFPYPVFGNCSRAYKDPVTWRSIPRMVMTQQFFRLRTFDRLYRSNQVWVYPACNDIPPLGTNGDVFASVAPYWILTQGRSYSDLPYLRAALKASAAFPPETKREMLARGLLAPTIQMLLRRSLKAVRTEADYLTPAAHPTAFPAGGLDVKRLVAMAGALKVEDLAPIANLQVLQQAVDVPPGRPEPTYASPCSCAFVLRASDAVRYYRVRAFGGEEYAFVQVHGAPGAIEVSEIEKDFAQLVVHRDLLSPTNRADLAVFAKSKTSGWGAPSFVSFAVVDPKAPYCDWLLQPMPPLPLRPEERKSESETEVEPETEAEPETGGKAAPETGA